MQLDLMHALIAMREHAFVPFGVEHARARLECHLLGQCAHRATAACLVADVNRRHLGIRSLSALHRAADTAERVEVRVDGRHTDFHRIQVLVGQFHAREHALQQVRLGDRTATRAIRKALAAGISLGQLVFIIPAAAVDQMIHVRAIRTLGIAEHAQRGRLHVAALLLLIGQRMLANEVVFFRFIGARGHQRGFGQHADLQRQQIAEDARERNQYIHSRAAKFFQRYQ